MTSSNNHLMELVRRQQEHIHKLHAELEELRDFVVTGLSNEGLWSARQQEKQKEANIAKWRAENGF